MEEARSLISSDGLDALTLRRLADRFSVSAPALYFHFRDKEELLRLLEADSRWAPRTAEPGAAADGGA